jgi:hypothetical protein
LLAFFYWFAAQRMPAKPAISVQFRALSSFMAMSGFRRGLGHVPMKKSVIFITVLRAGPVPV